MPGKYHACRQILGILSNYQEKMANKNVRQESINLQWASKIVSMLIRASM
jgi:hypothetical protein|tara:strand:+ start:339 stop:488 length:150 start_codon:yes stop_codon:yes gene_type:complete